MPPTLHACGRGAGTGGSAAGAARGAGGALAAYMTGSAPSVTILKQFRWGSEVADACTCWMRVGDATMSCRRPAAALSTRDAGARASARLLLSMLPVVSVPKWALHGCAGLSHSTNQLG